MSARGWVESLGIEYSAARTAESTAGGIAWLTDLDAARAARARGVHREARGHRTAEGLLLDCVEWRSQAERIPTDPASRRQDPATARPAVAAGASRADGDRDDEGVRSVGEARADEAQKATDEGRDGAPVRGPGRSVARVARPARGRHGRKRSHRPGDLAQAGARAEPRCTSSDARPPRLDAVVAEIREHGGTAHAAQVDLEDDAAVTRFFASLPTSTSS